jgi:hypothetical protein
MIPLAAPLGGANVKLAEDDATNCPGTVADPQANGGFLCVYTGTLTDTQFAGPFSSGFLPSIFAPSTGAGTGGADTSGAVLQFFNSAANAQGWGTFAVTAP